MPVVFQLNNLPNYLITNYHSISSTINIIITLTY